MSVVRANIQTVEDMYRLIRTAIASTRPIEAVYKGYLGCFVRIDWAEIAAERCGCCVTSMAEKAKADWKHRDRPANWRCIALEKFSEVKLKEGAWRTAPNHSRPASCVIDADIDAEDQPDGLPPQKGQ